MGKVSKEETMKSVILALLLTTSSAFAMGGKSEGHKRAEEFKKELNLSDEQVEKFRELKKNKGELKELKAQFKASKKAFHEAAKDPNAGNDELKTKFDTFMRLRDEFQRKRFERMLEKRALLTVEQRAKFNELLKNWRGKKGKGKRKHW